MASRLTSSVPQQSCRTLHHLLPRVEPCFLPYPGYGQTSHTQRFRSRQARLRPPSLVLLEAIPGSLPVVHHKISSRSPEEGRIFGNGTPLRKTFSIGFVSLPPFKIRSPLVGFQPKVGLIPIFHLLWVFAPEEHTTDSGYSFHSLCFYCVKI